MLIALFTLILIALLVLAWIIIKAKGDARGEFVAKSLRSMELQEEKDRELERRDPGF